MRHLRNLENISRMKLNIFRISFKVICRAVSILFAISVIGLCYLKKRKKVVYLDGMTHATGQSFRDFPPDVKEKYRLPGGDRYVTFDEYQDIRDKEKSLYSSSSQS